MSGNVPTSGSTIQLTNNVKVSQAVKIAENPGLPIEPFTETTIVKPVGTSPEDINDLDFLDFFEF